MNRLCLGKIFLSVFLWVLLAPNFAQAAELSEIKRRGRLVVAVKDNFIPLGFRDSQGRLQGFEIELARQLAQDLLGNPEALVFKPVTNQKRLAAVVSGEVDFAIANLTATNNRRRVVDFSEPYYTGSTRLVAKSRTIRTAKDLKAIAVLQRSHNIAVLRSVFPRARLLGVSSYADAAASIASNKANAFAGDAAVLAGWIARNPDYYYVGQPMARRPVANALPKGLQHQSLTSRVNQAVMKLRATGWLQQRRRFWGLE